MTKIVFDVTDYIESKLSLNQSLKAAHHMFSWKNKSESQFFTNRFFLLKIIQNISSLLLWIRCSTYSEFGIGFFREIMVNSSYWFQNSSSFWVTLKLCSGSPTLLPCSSHKLSLIYIYEFEKSRFSETCLDDSRGLADNFIDSFICFSTTQHTCFLE